MKTTLLFVLSFLLSIHSLPAKSVSVSWHRTLETVMILRAISADDYFFSRVPAAKKGRPMLYKARQRFSAYKGHPAVVHTQRMLNETKDLGGIVFSGVLYAEELPGTALKSEPTDVYWAQHKQALIDYMQALGDFYRQANVQQFLDDNKDFYTGAVAEAEQYIDRDIVESMEAYFGKSNAAYKLYLLPMSPYGWGFSATTTQMGKTTQHAIISPVKNIEWEETSGSKEFGFGGAKAAAHYQELVIHEYVHSFITDLLLEDTMKQLIAKYDSLFTPMLDSVMQEQAYGDWWGYVNEYLVRLGHIRVEEKNNPAAARQLRRADYDEYKFVTLPEGEKLMEQYERNRQQYKTIGAFLPVLISHLGHFTKAEIDKRIAQPG